MSLQWSMGCPVGGKPGPGYPARLRPGRNQPGRQGGGCAQSSDLPALRQISNWGGTQGVSCKARPSSRLRSPALPSASRLSFADPISKDQVPECQPPPPRPEPHRSPRVSESPWCRAWEAPALPASPLPHPTGLFLMTVGGVPGVSPLLLAPGTRVSILPLVHAQLYSHLRLTPSPCLLIFLGHHNPVFPHFSSSIFLSWVGGGASAMILFSPFPAQTPPPPGPSGRG